MNNPQSYAIEIEHQMWKIFNCERFGVGGLVNSDYIRKYPFHSMVCALMHLYSTSNKKAIESFFENYSFYADWSIDTILSFENQEKVIDGITYQLDAENGQKVLEKMLDKFIEIIQ